MVGVGQKRQIAWELRTGRRAVPAGRFEKMAGHSSRVRCVLCGTVGGGPVNPRVEDLQGRSWQIGCVIEHPVRCRCGLSFRSEGHLSQHVAAHRYPERALMHGPLAHSVLPG